MCHVPDTRSFNDKIAAVISSCAAGRGDPDRSFPCNRCRGGGGWIRHGAAWSWPRCGSLDSGPAGAARDGAALSGGAWVAQTSDDGSTFPPRRCDDRHRGRIAVQGAGCGDRRNPGRSCGSEFHHDEEAGASGRGDRRALLADPAGGNRRSQCGARSLADHDASFNDQSRRCARSGRSALAGRVVPLARRAAGGMGGTS